MKKKCFGVSVVIVFFVLMIYVVFCRHKINMLQNENNELQTKIASTQNENNELQAKIASTQIDDTYLSFVFPFNGCYYKDKSGNLKFYADSDCQVELTDVRLISNNCEYVNLGDGKHVYAVRLDNGKIAYCKESITFKVKEDDNY